MFDALSRSCATYVDEIRQLERKIMDLVRARRAACRARTSSRRSRRTRPNLRWIDKHIRAKRKHSSRAREARRTTIEQQQKLLQTLEKRVPRSRSPT